jgi:uncharacterized protein YkwD
VQIWRHILVVSALFLAFAAPATAGVTSTGLLKAMNDARAEQGLAPLKTDPTLRKAAGSYSHEMLAGGFFDHRNFVARMMRFGVRGPFVGENLAWAAPDNTTADAIVAGWLASPPHRKNLLQPRFRLVGLGFATGSFSGVDGATIVAAEFAGR